MLIEPFNGLAVLVACLGDNPDDHLRLLAGCVGNDLTKVVVVGFLQLVLDDDLSASAQLGGEQIDLEGADLRLGLHGLEFDADGLSEGREVLLLSEPLREVKRLMWPYLAEVYLRQCPKLNGHAAPSYVKCVGEIVHQRRGGTYAASKVVPPPAESCAI